ncbi:MAG: hypothetical protein H6727_00505 [Myxococcales bacterium]|nr:hypothetical protein [Myxococcales bacterium]
MKRWTTRILLTFCAAWLLGGIHCAPTPPTKTEPTTETSTTEVSKEPTAEPTNESIPDASAESTPEKTPPEPTKETTPDPTWPPGTPPRCPDIRPQAVPASLRLSPFYQKYVDAGGIAIVSSAKVPDTVFARTYYMLANMLRDKPCLREALRQSGTHIGLIAVGERTTEIPEYSDLNTAFPNVDWDKRARGLGATLVRPVTTGAEENILQSTQDPWRGELIMLHEFAHAVFEFGIQWLEDGTTQQDNLKKIYQEALANGLWANTYAATNEKEYWAEAVQSWFDNNLEADPPNGIHNHVNTRAELKQYDPKMADFVAQFFDGRSWPVYCSLQDGPAWQDPTPTSPTNVTCKFRKVILQDQGCGSLGNFVSNPSQTTAQIEIPNRDMQKRYTIWRIDTQGQATQVQSLSPRGQATLSSFVGEAWMLRNEADECVGLYRATHPENVIVME